MEFEIFTLSNGLRGIHQQRSGEAAHFGLFINTGSRDETEEEIGLAHMLEHCLFKGTGKRKAYHILNRMDNIGGDINAFTTKEETSIHTSFLKGYYERAIELVFDIAFDPVFPDKEITREKLIILDEYHAYKEDPSDQIFEDFDCLIFRGHPLGRSILGEPENIKKIRRSDVVAFHKKHYRPSNMAIASVGDISTKKLIKYLEKHLPETPRENSPSGRSAPTPLIPFKETLRKPVHQAHIMLGNRAFDNNHPDRSTLILLNNLLGGPSLNNRLNLNISEKHGFAYHLESNYTSFSDTGLFSIYMSTDVKRLEKSLLLLQKELRKLRDQKLGPMQLHQAKQQIKGQIALGYENGLNIMLALGKSLLSFDKVDTLEDIYRKIDAITAENLMRVANRVFDPEELSALIYLPEQ